MQQKKETEIKKEKITKLKNYIISHGMTVKSMARVLSLPYNTMYGAAQGVSISLVTAHKIVTFTKGEITYEDLLPEEKNKKKKDKKAEKPMLTHIIDSPHDAQNNKKKSNPKSI